VQGFVAAPRSQSVSSSLHHRLAGLDVDLTRRSATESLSREGTLCVILYRMSEEWPVEVRLRQAQERRHIISAIVRATESWAEVLTVIADSPSAEAARTSLRERFGLDEVQATALLDIQFRRVAVSERQRMENELALLDAEIARLEGDQ
jgi:hypothetical protein